MMFFRGVIVCCSLAFFTTSVANAELTKVDWRAPEWKRYPKRTNNCDVIDTFHGRARAKTDDHLYRFQIHLDMRLARNRAIVSAGKVLQMPANVPFRLRRDDTKALWHPDDQTSENARALADAFSLFGNVVNFKMKLKGFNNCVFVALVETDLDERLVMRGHMLSSRQRNGRWE